MECVCEPEKECNNEDFSKCKECIAPSWCFCTREGANMGQSIVVRTYEGGLMKEKIQRIIRDKLRRDYPLISDWTVCDLAEAIMEVVKCECGGECERGEK